MRRNKQSLPVSELLDKALQLHRSGELEQAREMYEQLLETDPNHVVALHLLGMVAHHFGQHDKAKKLIRRAIEAGSELSFRFLNELGNVHRDLEELPEAARCFQEAIALKPDYADAYYGLATIHQLQGQLDNAASYYEKALQLNIDTVEALIGMGEFFEANDRVDEAISCYQKVIQSESIDSKAVYMKLGILHGQLDRLPEAISCFQQALELMPEWAAAHYNLGLAFQKQCVFDKAILAYKKALEVAPDHADAYINMGSLYQNQGRLDAAVDCYQQALRINPDNAPACSNMGLLLRKLDRIDEATQWFEKALDLDPEYGDCLANLVYHLKDICDWKRLETLSARLDVLNREAIDGSGQTPEAPFSNLTRHADPALNYAVATSWAADIIRRISNTDIRFQFDERRRGRKKITIGYLSNNFGNHPVAHLMQSLYGLHDRDVFEIFCYSYGKDDGSHYRKKIEQDCDRFIDLFDMSPLDSAKCINRDQVDILVDLVGHTDGNRLTICAYRPAPIQVAFLGFPGTSGADFIDYIITDRTVTPEKDAQFYSENFVYMPDSYQINDDSAANSEWRSGKSDIGLPDGSFVFCSFNRPFKIEPILFDSWMKILRAVDKAVLWLISRSEGSERNLRAEARSRGVDPDRLIFAEMMPLDDHLERLKFADLALDTHIYNGGATTSHALRAGIPLITLRGDHFLSRMSASTLVAAGLPELITMDFEQYEALAIRLANNPAELESVKMKIENNCLDAPVFDTPRFASNLEKAYREMWEIFLSGQSARQIILRPDEIRND